jgi:hypothetical protein
MMQRVVGPAMAGAARAREAVLSGVSRVGLEAIDLWASLRANVRHALARPSRLLAGLSLPWSRRRARAAMVPVAVDTAGRSRLVARLLDAVLVGATVFVVILMHREIYLQMQASPAYRARVEDLRMAVRPAWAPQETVVVTVPMDATLAKQAQGCDAGLVGEVARRLESSPWVRRVVEVRRSYPDRVEARVELRRPQACILRGTRTMYVDADGVRLPDLRPGTPMPEGCYEVAGVDGPVPAVGAPWGHAGVRGALDVIRSLDAYRVERVLAVTRIDVSNIGGRRDARESEIVCWAASGVPVAWGRPSTTDAFGENEVGTKMRLLALALEAFPSLRGLERVDLRFDRVVVRPRPEWRMIASAASAGSLPQ